MHLSKLIAVFLASVLIWNKFAFAGAECENSNIDPSDFAVTAYQNHECLAKMHIDRVGEYSCTVTEVVSSDESVGPDKTGRSFNMKITALVGEEALRECQMVGRSAQFLTLAPRCGFPFGLEKDDGSFSGYKNSSDAWIFDGLSYSGQFIFYSSGEFTSFSPGGQGSDEIIRGICRRI